MFEEINTMVETSKISADIRLEAWAQGCILDRKSLEVVGWLYEWNTGERVPRWKDGKCTDVIFQQE